MLAGGTGFAGGFAHDGIVGGIKGAAEGILIERGLRSPTARIIGGKVIQKTSKILPTASKVFQGIKAPLVNKATGK